MRPFVVGIVLTHAFALYQACLRPLVHLLVANRVCVCPHPHPLVSHLRDSVLEGGSNLCLPFHSSVSSLRLM